MKHDLRKQVRNKTSISLERAITQFLRLLDEMSAIIHSWKKDTWKYGEPGEPRVIESLFRRP